MDPAAKSNHLYFRPSLWLLDQFQFGEEIYGNLSSARDTIRDGEEEDEDEEGKKRRRNLIKFITSGMQTLDVFSDGVKMEDCYNSRRRLWSEHQGRHGDEEERRNWNSESCKALCSGVQVLGKMEFSALVRLLALGKQRVYEDGYIRHLARISLPSVFLCINIIRVGRWEISSNTLSELLLPLMVVGVRRKNI